MSKASREFKAERKEYNIKFPDSAYTREEMTLKRYKESRRYSKHVRFVLKKKESEDGNQ